MYTGIPYCEFLDTSIGRCSIDNVRIKFTYKFATYDWDRREAVPSIDHISNYMNSFQTRVHVGRKTYIIAAHSMSPFVYWEQKLLGEGEVVQAFDLNETVTDSNMSFLHDTPQAVPDSVFWVVLISVVMIGFLLVIFVKR